MAMLQAARARALGLDEEAAFSWGLNRAIFFAAAKRGFRTQTAGVPAPEGGTPASGPNFTLGDDGAYRDESTPALRFTIGGTVQTPEEFHRQIASRFGGEAGFRSAWRQAREIVKGFDGEALRSRRRFFDDVYRPRRDLLSEEWTHRFVGSAPDAPSKKRV